MNRRAFSLMELLVVIGILPIFMLVATQLYRGILITADTSHRVMAIRSTFDTATEQMWRDLFSARELRWVNARTVMITERGGQQIRWQGVEGNLRRTGADSRTFQSQRDLQLRVGMENHAVVMQLVGPQGCMERVVCSPPFLLRRPS